MMYSTENLMLANPHAFQAEPYYLLCDWVENGSASFAYPDFLRAAPNRYQTGLELCRSGHGALVDKKEVTGLLRLQRPAFLQI
jgi:hypothetical protein